MWRLERKCNQRTLLLWVQMIKGWLGGPFRMMQVKFRVEPLLKNTSEGPEISVWGSRIWEMTIYIIYHTVFCRCFEYTHCKYFAKRSLVREFCLDKLEFWLAFLYIICHQNDFVVNYWRQNDKFSSHFFKLERRLEFSSKLN